MLTTLPPVKRQNGQDCLAPQARHQPRLTPNHDVDWSQKTYLHPLIPVCVQSPNTGNGSGALMAHRGTAHVRRLADIHCDAEAEHAPFSLLVVARRDQIRGAPRFLASFGSICGDVCSARFIARARLGAASLALRPFQRR